MKRAFALCLLAMSAMPSVAAKEPLFVVSKAVADKPAVSRDAAMGYVLLRSEIQTPLHLMRLPSPEDEATYNSMRTAALEKEQKKYPGNLARYKSKMATYEILKKDNKSLKPPEKPIEPTEENFVFTPFNLLAGVSIGPLNRFSKGENDKSVYLQAITPGAYRIYGLLSVAPGQGALGTCFCMGSVKFTVNAGEVVDLGMISRGGALVPSLAGSDIDPRLADWPVKAADYKAVGKLPNYFGLTLSRIPPIAGVIGYTRDRIVDLTAERTEPGVSDSSTSVEQNPVGT